MRQPNAIEINAFIEQLYEEKRIRRIERRNQNWNAWVVGISIYDIIPELFDDDFAQYAFGRPY